MDCLEIGHTVLVLVSRHFSTVFVLRQLFGRIVLVLYHLETRTCCLGLVSRVETAIHLPYLGLDYLETVTAHLDFLEISNIWESLTQWHTKMIFMMGEKSFGLSWNTKVMSRESFLLMVLILDCLEIGTYTVLVFRPGYTVLVSRQFLF